ncbi:MAG: HIT domain-containing protein [Sinobacterium sp.]|nr:HIT domain-containing protein [Sinobacterium sp.]
MFKLDSQLEKDTVHIASFELCDALLAKDANYPWVILVPRKENLTELHQLEDTELQTFWAESAYVSKHLEIHYQAHKLNVAALGNVVQQLHVHHIVRFHSDPAWPKPIWGVLPSQPYSDDELEVTINSLKALFSTMAVSV